MKPIVNEMKMSQMKLSQQKLSKIAEEIPNTKGRTKGPKNRQNHFATLALIKTQHTALRLTKLVQ